jgi:hypothetical protein
MRAGPCSAMGICRHFKQSICSVDALRTAAGGWRWLHTAYRRALTCLVQQSSTLFTACQPADSLHYTGHVTSHFSLLPHHPRPDPYMQAFQAMMPEAHAHLSNPLRRYSYWSADARAGMAVMAAHDKALEQKLAAAFKARPPEHTVAGGGCCRGWIGCLELSNFRGVDGVGGSSMPAAVWRCARLFRHAACCNRLRFLQMAP